ncbi:unnamed protein product [Amoebophrya sp. A25]|nr:unnamed protein product [Amoebophrya sp. A25]|eukprot:GSA25T00005963001.1
MRPRKDAACSCVARCSLASERRRRRPSANHNVVVYSRLQIISGHVVNDASIVQEQSRPPGAPEAVVFSTALDTLYTDSNLAGYGEATKRSSSTTLGPGSGSSTTTCSSSSANLFPDVVPIFTELAQRGVHIYLGFEDFSVRKNTEPASPERTFARKGDSSHAGRKGRHAKAKEPGPPQRATSGGKPRAKKRDAVSSYTRNIRSDWEVQEFGLWTHAEQNALLEVLHSNENYTSLRQILGLLVTADVLRYVKGLLMMKNVDLASRAGGRGEATKTLLPAYTHFLLGKIADMTRLGRTTGGRGGQHLTLPVPLDRDRDNAEDEQYTADDVGNFKENMTGRGKKLDLSADLMVVSSNLMHLKEVKDLISPRVLCVQARQAMGAKGLTPAAVLAPVRYGSPILSGQFLPRSDFLPARLRWYEDFVVRRLETELQKLTEKQKANPDARTLARSEEAPPTTTTSALHFAAPPPPTPIPLEEQGSVTGGLASSPWNKRRRQLVSVDPLGATKLALEIARTALRLCKFYHRRSVPVFAPVLRDDPFAFAVAADLLREIGRIGVHVDISFIAKLEDELTTSTRQTSSMLMDNTQAPVGVTRDDPSLEPHPQKWRLRDVVVFIGIAPNGLRKWTLAENLRRSLAARSVRLVAVFEDEQVLAGVISSAEKSNQIQTVRDGPGGISSAQAGATSERSQSPPRRPSETTVRVVMRAFEGDLSPLEGGGYSEDDTFADIMLTRDDNIGKTISTTSPSSSSTLPTVSTANLLPRPSSSSGPANIAGEVTFLRTTWDARVILLHVGIDGERARRGSVLLGQHWDEEERGAFDSPRVVRFKKKLRVLG